jgi:hypothetical protein
MMMMMPVSSMLCPADVALMFCDVWQQYRSYHHLLDAGCHVLLGSSLTQGSVAAGAGAGACASSPSPALHCTAFCLALLSAG